MLFFITNKAQPEALKGKESWPVIFLEYLQPGRLQISPQGWVLQRPMKNNRPRLLAQHAKLLLAITVVFTGCRVGFQVTLKKQLGVTTLPAQRDTQYTAGNHTVNTKKKGV